MNLFPVITIGSSLFTNQIHEDFFSPKAVLYLRIS